MNTLRDLVFGRTVAPSRRRPPVPLSETSDPPWAPPPDRPLLIYDVLVSAVVAAASAWLSRSSGPSAWDRFQSPAIGVSAGLATFALLRRLPTLSHERLLECEAALLDTVQGDVRHHWTAFTSASGAAWHVHALWLRSAAAVAAEESLIAAADASPQSPAHAALPGEMARAAGRLPVVLLHGHSTSAAHWESVVDRIGALADVFLIDLPGWGRTPSPRALADSRDPQLSTRLVLEMLDGWLNANALGRVVLIGHSLGGFYASLFARQAPHRVSQLILVSPAGLLTAAPSFEIKWGVYFKFLTPQVRTGAGSAVRR